MYSTRTIVRVLLHVCVCVFLCVSVWNWSQRTLSAIYKTEKICANCHRNV